MRFFLIAYSSKIYGYKKIKSTFLDTFSMFMGLIKLTWTKIHAVWFRSSFFFALCAVPILFAPPFFRLTAVLLLAIYLVRPQLM